MKWHNYPWLCVLYTCTQSFVRFGFNVITVRQQLGKKAVSEMTWLPRPYTWSQSSSGLALMNTVNVDFPWAIVRPVWFRTLVPVYLVWFGLLSFRSPNQPYKSYKSRFKTLHFCRKKSLEDMGYGKHRRSRGGNSNPGQTSRTENLGRYYKASSFSVVVYSLVGWLLFSLIL